MLEKLDFAQRALGRHALRKGARDFLDGDLALAVRVARLAHHAVGARANHLWGWEGGGRGGGEVEGGTVGVVREIEWNGALRGEQ